MEQVATKLRPAGLARIEHRDTDRKGLPSEGYSTWTRENRAWMRIAHWLGKRAK